jgi:peptidoglycan/xylan/chitin deacetylase (PgdA/CDA1 family)
VSFLSDALKNPRFKRALYRSGALDAWHRRRNRDRLTVIMYHRVLATRDPRWPTSDPEYTLPDDLFAETLGFFKRHYNVIGLDDLLSGRRLPERPLLITFDDGWSDNEEYALRRLREAGLPALLFVVADAVDRAQPFWQEQMITAWRSGRLDTAACQRVAGELGARFVAGASRDDLEPLRGLIAALEQTDAATRARLLGSIATELDDGVRYMITNEQLRALAAGGVAIGAHGQTHNPLTQVDAGAELATARRVLEGLLAGRPVTTLSFPHGKFDDGVVARAWERGYQLLFTSVPELPKADGNGRRVLGRVGFTTETITGADGKFAPELLALHLFRKPHARG